MRENTGVDKGAQWAQGGQPPNGRAKKIFFVKIEGLFAGTGARRLQLKL